MKHDSLEDADDDVNRDGKEKHDSPENDGQMLPAVALSVFKDRFHNGELNTRQVQRARQLEVLEQDGSRGASAVLARQSQNW